MPFPIFTHLKSGGTVIQGELPIPFHKEEFTRFRKVTLIQGVDPDPPDSLYSFTDVRVVDDALSKIGPLKPPFEEMWIEYDLVKTDKKFEHIPGAIGGAAMVVAYEADGERPEMLEIAAYIRYEGDHYLNCSIGMVIEINPDGTILKTSFGIRDEKLAYLFEDHTEWRSTWMMCYPVLYSIGLMNCRNVSLKEERYRSRRSSPKARKAEPKLVYQTIVLPQPKRQKGEALGGSAADPKIHKVRGHFKTYTADAPLLGKHVGTFWWPWTVRGSADNGAVVSKYEVRKA